MAAGLLLKRPRQKLAIDGVKKVKHKINKTLLLLRGQEEGEIRLKEEEVILKQNIIKTVINFRKVLPQKVTEVNNSHKFTKQ